MKAAKEILKTRIVWVFTHLVQYDDCINQLVVLSSRTSGDCASDHRRSHPGTTLEQKSDITDLCSQMILQLHNVYDQNKVKVVCGSSSGVVVAESKRAQASWVLLGNVYEQGGKLENAIATIKPEQSSGLLLF